MTTLPKKTTEWIRSLHEDAVRNDRDAVILLTGREGVGKSTLALQLAQAANPDFSIDFIVYDGAEMAQVAHDAPPGSVILLDESSNGANSREAMTKENRSLVKFLQTGRYLNHTYILCFPNKNWLDSYIRDHRAEWWILVEKRGMGIVHRGMNRDYKAGNRPWMKQWGLSYGALEGPLWDAYVEKKHREARMMMEKEAGRYVPDPQEVKRMAQVFQVILEKKGGFLT